MRDISRAAAVPTQSSGLTASSPASPATPTEPTAAKTAAAHLAQASAAARKASIRLRSDITSPAKIRKSMPTVTLLQPPHGIVGRRPTTARHSRQILSASAGAISRARTIQPLRATVLAVAGIASKIPSAIRSPRAARTVFAAGVVIPVRDGLAVRRVMLPGLGLDISATEVLAVDIDVAVDVDVDVVVTPIPVPPTPVPR